MDEELPDPDALARPLLKDPQGDSSTTAPVSSASLLSSGTGDGEGGDGAGGLEQQDGDANSPPRRQIPTLVFILVPMVVFLAGIFLAAAFMPPSAANGEDPAPAPSTGGTNSSASGEEVPPLHDVPVAPSLLFVRDDEGLVNVRENGLYRRLKYATFQMGDESDATMLTSGEGRPTLGSDRREIGYGEPLQLTWEHAAEDEDVLAMYCPAGETNPRQFRDAATVAQVRATHRYHSQQQGEDGNAWHIPSFPIVREESCEFRLYAHSDEGGLAGNGHQYTLRASTFPISLTSNQSPTGIHLSLTGNPSEMAIQFATGDSGTPLVEIAKKSDIGNVLRTSTLADTRELAQAAVWTKFKGVSTSYAATDMCQEPASSTDPGWFVSPGHLHTVVAKELDPDTDYAYRAGLSFGQGIKWSDDYYVFRSSPAKGAGAPAPGEPALTFVALGDQGCADSVFKHKGGHQGDNVTDLIASMMEEVDRVDVVGDLSYADGAAHVWDLWHLMIEQYAARVPVMVGVGNHDYDHTEGGDGGKDPSGAESASGFHPEWGKGGAFKSEGGECGVPVSKRFAVPDNGNGVFWYSYDQSLVHTVMLSAEHDMADGSPQHKWLEKDLATVDRSVTPWIVVELHRPLYHSEVDKAEKKKWSEQLVVEGMQNAVEDLLYAYQTDLVISGHMHSYFRSCGGLYSYKCDNGGPTFVTVGTGGAPLNGERSVLLENEYTACFDKEHYGVGRASVYNATSLHWEFIAVGGNVVDEVWLTRKRERRR